MKKLIGLLLMLPLMGAEPAGYKYWSAAELKGLSKPLSNKTDAKTSLENLASFGSADHAMMVHREGSGQAEQHEAEADLMVIVSGKGDLIIGGTMPGAKTTAAGELRGPSIEVGLIRSWAWRYYSRSAQDAASGDAGWSADHLLRAESERVAHVSRE